MSRPRKIATIVHRYTGLVMAGFLTIVGLTGAIIAWNDELERVFAPSLFVLPHRDRTHPPLDVFTLREMAERESGFAINGVDWTRCPDKPALFYVEAKSGGPEPHDDQIALDPATGRIVGARRAGDLRQGIVNTMPFIYALHDSLALGGIGVVTLGVIALLWTIDCFVGAYLTFPARAIHARAPPAWLSRWRPAWAIRWKAGGYKRLYDLHRVGGLWPWALMLPIAWSSVAFNLPQVYNPVMMAVMGLEPETPSTPVIDNRLTTLGWREAHIRARQSMATLARRDGFSIRSERLMFFDPASKTYSYRVLSDRDPGETGNTQIMIDGRTGKMIGYNIPTGRVAGTTLTNWVADIHVADLLGFPMKIVMTIFGLGVASLSITGVLLWWRKGAARRQRRKSAKSCKSLPA